MRRTLHAVRRFLTLAPLLVLCACAAASRSAAPSPPPPDGGTGDAAPTARPAELHPLEHAAIDLGTCFVAGEVADPSLMRWIGNLMDGGADWRSALGGAISGPLGRLLACGLAGLATMRPQAGPAPASGRVLPLSPAGLIYERADRCHDGPCTKAEERAASFLRELAGHGLIALPPSGEG